MNIEKLAKRVAETNALANEILGTSLSPSAPAPGNKMAAYLAKRQTLSVLRDEDKFASQQEYDDALYSMPEPTHDGNGEPYRGPDPFLKSLQDAALRRAQNPASDPDADLKEQLRREALVSTPPHTELEDAAHSHSAPRSHAEWQERANALNVRAQKIGLYILVVPGTHVPVALGPGGAVIEVNSLRLSNDPAGRNVLGQGSLQAIGAQLASEEREYMRTKAAIEATEAYQRRKAQEYADAREQQAIRNSAPQLLAQMRAELADLKAQIAVSES
jgi:hypothetical protein